MLIECKHCSNNIGVAANQGGLAICPDCGKYTEIPNDVPEVTFRKDIYNLHMLYLQKFELMTEEERACFVKYFEHLSKPLSFTPHSPEP